jgi:coproporphyrinogen III oxidase
MSEDENTRAAFQPRVTMVAQSCHRNCASARGRGLKRRRLAYLTAELAGWTAQQRRHQLVRRGRNGRVHLFYDRGTTFGLKTGGDVEAILMSLPPEAGWPWRCCG